MRTNSPETLAPELPMYTSPEVPFIEPSPQSIDTLAPSDSSFRTPPRHSRLTRTLLTLTTATGLLTAASTVETPPATADESLVYTVQDTGNGVYARKSPHQNDTDRILGQGAYDGDHIRLLCGTTNGDPVGPYNNRTWHKVLDLTNNQGPFWINDHWTDTPVKARKRELAPGEEGCGGGDEGVQPAAPVRQPDARQASPTHRTHIVGQCAGPLWGVGQQDICINAHMGEKDSANHRQWVGDVDAAIPTKVPSRLEVWGDNFYHKDFGTDRTWRIGKWVASGSGVCAAATDKHNVREVACITVEVP